MKAISIRKQLIKSFLIFFFAVISENFLFFLLILGKLTFLFCYHVKKNKHNPGLFTLTQKYNKIILKNYVNFILFQIDFFL